MNAKTRNLFDPSILGQALVEALKKFHPRAQLKNPVIFVTLIGALVSSACAIASLLQGAPVGF